MCAEHKTCLSCHGSACGRNPPKILHFGVHGSQLATRVNDVDAFGAHSIWKVWYTRLESGAGLLRRYMRMLILGEKVGVPQLSPPPPSICGAVPETNWGDDLSVQENPRQK